LKGQDTMNRKIATIVGVALLGVFIAGNYIASGGDLNPPPGPVSPTMHTLDDIYNSLTADCTDTV